MNWDLLISTLVTIGTLATTVWVMLKFLLKDIRREITDIRREITDIHKGISSIEYRLEKIETSVYSLDKRLTGLESSFEERGRWEARLELKRTKGKE